MTHFHCKYKNSNFEVKSHTVKEQNSQTQTRENTKHSLHQKSHEAKKKKNPYYKDYLKCPEIQG